MEHLGALDLSFLSLVMFLAFLLFEVAAIQVLKAENFWLTAFFACGGVGAVVVSFIAGELVTNRLAAIS